ncbi:remodeling and spacing factor 1 isoform X1 [Bombyx mandarina]|uniref:Remodeling and spacing factor 1 isoform X1 n=1 Tax=Bombyx mandarina TaxID=7092 RepID=A0A6J2K7P7_BOMMA|nr:remodeling and spacing factor 1 isoform X1 [Bombyx mandarina]
MASDGEILCTNDPNFAVIYSFLKVFGKLYGLVVPSITKLQDYIEDTQEVAEPLKDLHLRLLRRAQKSVLSSRWEKCLIKFCHQQRHHQEAWEIERFTYKKASTQVKLKVLKILLEYQFTCHLKFKTAVNAISCKELRLDPIGRDKNGCVYWLEVDHEANLCLYKEDQDEETWQLVARNREELANVISKLKGGEDVCPLNILNTQEDSSSTPEASQPEKEKPESHEEENEEEFLSPESETDAETDDKNDEEENDEKCITEVEKDKTAEVEKDKTAEVEKDKTTEVEKDKGTEVEKDKSTEVETSKSNEEFSIVTEENVESTNEEVNQEQKEEPTPEEQFREVNEAHPPEESSNSEEFPKETVDDIVEKELIEKSEKEQQEDDRNLENKDEVGETIEEPVMVITGEGNGADCEGLCEELKYFSEEDSDYNKIYSDIVDCIDRHSDFDSSYFYGDEIVEEFMYFYGEGSGFDNCTGNPEVEHTNSTEDNTDIDEDAEECVNGEHEDNSSDTKISKDVNLKSCVPSLINRSLKKQSNDTAEVLKSDPKKHCIRDLEKPDISDTVPSENSANTNINENNDTENVTKDSIKKVKGRNKFKKKAGLRKSSIKESISCVPETDNGHDVKSSIIEKRKNSVSSEDQEGNTDNERDKSPEKGEKAEDDLPTKKLRLEMTPETDGNITHSKENESDSINNSIEKDSINSISQRKKIKAIKGKFKRKIKIKNSTVNKSEEDRKVSDKKGKSLKRSILEATISDKDKTESQSDSDEDIPVASGKRLKTKPKKLIKSTRKKVEAKLLEKHSSDESDEETLYSLAGKKSPRKIVKKKLKIKDKQKATKSKSRGGSDDDDVTPVRQSRRIAQQKIKEEAERRHQEEVALRELKLIHKKKKEDEDEEEWVASDVSSPRVRRWSGSASDEPSPDSDSDEPLFDQPPEEPDLNFDKSDHEFSPESDLESGEPVEPTKRARTLQEGQDEGFCKRCGSGEQPEWILLCDRCDAGYHASCLKPMLFVVPEGDWFCPQCNHEKLIESLELELVKYDELMVLVEEERARKKAELKEKAVADAEAGAVRESDKRPDKRDQDSESEESSSSWSSSSSGAVYRLRARRQLPVSYRSQEYDRLISTAIKEEYVEPTTSAGNQGRGKDISTIIEAAEEEKLKAEREAVEQGKPLESKKMKRKQRRKPRKLNSLDVPSEDDDETDEDFKDVGMESSSEEISSSAERESTESRSSDSLPIRRTGRTDKKERPKLVESSPEVKKKKKGVFTDSSSEAAEHKEWRAKKKSKEKRRDRSKGGKSRKRRGSGGRGSARVLYGGLSDHEPGAPAARTRHRKIDYTEMPNTESEEEMHKSSGKHMPDSSDEFKLEDSEASSDSGDDSRKQRALADLIHKTAVVPIEKLPDHVAKAKAEELQNHLSAQLAGGVRAARGRGGRGARGSSVVRRRGAGRGRRGRGAAADAHTDEALAKLVGVKIKELGQDGTPLRPNQIERERKRQEREAKQAEKEAKRLERLQKREEKEKLKEQKAKEREEKKQAKLALQESKRLKKENQMSMGYGMQVGPGAPDVQRMGPYGAAPAPRPPAPPRLQVRAELRGLLSAEERPAPLHAHPSLSEGTLSVAGSPQPFKPVSEEPSVITRMPHMINQFRNQMMYGGGGPAYGPRGQGAVYMQGAARFPPRYYPGPAPPAYLPPPGPLNYARGPPHPMPPRPLDVRAPAHNLESRVPPHHSSDTRVPPNHASELRGSPHRGPDLHGPPHRGPEARGPPHHGPEMRALPNHGPEMRGPPNHGPEMRGPPNHGPEMRGPLNHGPEMRGPLTHGPEMRSPSNHGPEMRGPPNHGPEMRGLANHGPEMRGPSNHGPEMRGPPNHGPEMRGPLNHGPEMRSPPNHGPEMRSPPNHGPEMRGPPNHGPEMRGPPNHGPEMRGPPNHGPEMRGPPNHGPEMRGPPNHGPEMRGPPNHGPEMRGPLNHGPEMRGPLNHGPEMRGPPNHGPEMRGPPNHGPEMRRPPTLGLEVRVPPHHGHDVHGPPHHGPDARVPPQHASDARVNQHLGLDVRLPPHLSSDARVPPHHGPDTRVPAQHAPDVRAPHHGPDLRIPPHLGSEERVPSQHGADLRLPPHHDPESRLPVQHGPDTRIPPHHVPDTRILAHHALDSRIPPHHAPDSRIPPHHPPDSRIPAHHAPDSSRVSSHHIPESQVPPLHAPEAPLPTHSAPESRAPPHHAPSIPLHPLDSRVPPHLLDSRVSPHSMNSRVSLHAMDSRIPPHHLESRIPPVPSPHGPGFNPARLSVSPANQSMQTTKSRSPSAGPRPSTPGSEASKSAGPTPPPATLGASSPAAPVVDPFIRIKAEVKTEPEYRSPVGSPAPASPGPTPEPLRHPKIKHTENKDRRPRHPLGPYAPQYGPYGPYAPGPLPRGFVPEYGAPVRAAPPDPDGGEFGGLVSYFSSQQDADIDS